jgi:hypothetical protein
LKFQEKNSERRATEGKKRCHPATFYHPKGEFFADFGLLAAFRGAGARFASVPNDSGYPEGVETHIITADALRTADGEALSAPGPVEILAEKLYFPGIQRV